VGLDEERVYRNNVDKRDEFHVRILGVADRIKEGEDQLRPTTREVFLLTFNFLLYFFGRHLITFFVKKTNLRAQFFFLSLFIPILYMFRATKCSSSGQSIVSIRPLIYVTLQTVEWSKISKFILK